MFVGGKTTLNRILARTLQSVKPVLKEKKRLMESAIREEDEVIAKAMNKTYQ